VSIYGETGTGKELAARAVHYLGSRSSGPFIPLNCGSLPDTLLENELFGHERGAFTDAKSSQPGLIEQADGGTLFLDEVEDLSAKAQAALLRFLQEGEYRPLGSKTLKRANVRVVAASNVPFLELKKTGRLRNDLFYRLNVLPVFMPPLRERGEDILLMAEHFLIELRVRYDKPGTYLHPSSMRWIVRNDWPGNIREMENALHCGFLMAYGDAIYPHDMFPHTEAGGAARTIIDPLLYCDTPSSPCFQAYSVLAQILLLLDRTEGERKLVINGSDIISEIEAEVLGYLEQHPAASDTIEGIRKWWLMSRIARYSQPRIQNAVIHLEQQRLIERRVLHDGREIYVKPNATDISNQQEHYHA